MDDKTTPEKKTKNYYYDKKKKEVWCFTSDTNKCFVMGGLATVKEPIPAHDDELMGVTAEINALLARVVKRNKRRDVELHLLHTPRGMLLAWAHCDGAVSGDDKPSDIRKAFGLK